jgi:ABC-type nickel/cobalt efflux system permease component RcnA
MRWLTVLGFLTFPHTAMAGLAPPAGQGGTALPEPLASVLYWAFSLQRALNGEIRQHLAALKESGSWEPALALMLATFLYGVFHALGPGHGKVVIGTWFASRRARIVHSLAACGLSALVQAASAIGVVLALAGILALAPRDVMATAAWLEAGSYAVIAGMGALMMVRVIRGQSACGHDHRHDHDHETCCHGHHHHHGHDHAQASERRSLWTMAAAVGFRPCSGAILVLLFTLANGLLWIGILSTLTMAAGVALTVSGIGLSALGLNRLMERAFGKSRHADRLNRALALVGALTITVLGLTLLAGVIVNGPALSG